MKLLCRIDVRRRKGTKQNSMSWKWFHSKLLRRIIKPGEWHIALRKVEEMPVYRDQEKGKYIFCPVPNTETYWFADPILYEHKDRLWLFVEAYHRQNRRGEIGVFEIVDGCAKGYRTILIMDCHLSYPYIFEKDGKIYMIPESGNGKSINLFEAVDFPYTWEKRAVLCKDGIFRDSTVYAHNEEYYLFTYQRTDTNRYLHHTYKCFLFRIDFESGSLKAIEEYEDGNVNLRPAGLMTEYNGRRIHATQKCDRIYGESVIFWENSAKELSWKNAREIKRLDGDQIVIEGIGCPLMIHTYTCAGGYEVIDYRFRRGKD